MKKQTLNKNKVSKIKFNLKKKYILSKNRYTYLFENKLSNKLSDLKELKSLTILILKCGNDSKLLLKHKNFKLKNNQVILIENIKTKLKMGNEQNTILIAGTKTNKYKKKIFRKFDLSRSYKVKKHWGHELWLNGRNKNFAFKKIFLKKGNKTSLQYHNRKKETNFLYKGKIYLHYLSKNKKFNKIDYDKDIKKKYIVGPAVIDVEPKTVHRIEAITDLTLYETSTPHLDDVIRLQDDKLRKSGLISYEHSKR